MKGIILAGGTGSRLHPLTHSVSKQLMPIYDKPLIYYPLSVLMLANIRDILIISTPHDLPFFEKLLGNGSHIGLNISYEPQTEPRGLADAFLVGESFIGNDYTSLILGDNIFHGQSFSKILEDATQNLDGAKIFGYQVQNPEEFGVVQFDKNMNVTSLEEKPLNPKSNYAVTGLYFYDNDVIEIAKNIKPSSRGEIEITSINNAYLKNNLLSISLLGRGFAWLDTGTHNSLLDAGHFVHTIEKRQGFKITCLEEIAYRKKWIDDNELEVQINYYKNTPYGKYLINILRSNF